MGKRFVMTALLVCFMSTTANAQFNRHRRRGTILGGVAGAAIGAAIGDRSDNEAIGAVIGGVTGAAIGRNIGENKDHRIEHSGHQHSGHQNYSQPYYSQPQYTHPHHSYRYPVYTQPAPVVVPVPVPISPLAAPAVQPITQADVLNMLRSGLSESMVATQIQGRGMLHQLSVNDVIVLHQQGVSERLIEHMQANVIPGAPTSVTQPRPRSHTSYSTPSQPAVILNDASGQSIMAPSPAYPSAN